MGTKVLNGAVELFEGDVGNHDRGRLPASIRPKNPKLIANEQVLNQKSVGICLENRLRIADLTGRIVTLFCDAVTVLD